MPTFDLDNDSASIPITDGSVTPLVAYLNDYAFVPITIQNVVFTRDTNDPQVVLIPGCPCCLPYSGNACECPQNICVQCPNGYASGYQLIYFNQDIIFLSGYLIPADGRNPYEHPYDVVPLGTYRWLLTAFADCTWLYYQQIDLGIYPSLTSYMVYIKLYYDTGWKLYVDYAPSGTLFSDYIPSGNQVIFSLSGYTCCLTTDVSEGMSLISGSLAQSATILTHTSCGCVLVKPDCTSVLVPACLNITTPGSVTNPTRAVAAVASTVKNSWTGFSTGALAFTYNFVLTCTGSIFNLKIYKLPFLGTPVLEYDQNATSVTEYPILLIFPQAGFNFDGQFGTDTFTIAVHVPII